jgi:hypothetical protein
MEHPGAVFYNAPGLMLDESATQNQLLERASTISHETAHMWFGDLVTMKWFTDVWMKEVFANFMAAKIVNPSFPSVNHELRFLHTYYPAAYDVDRTAGTNAIRQPLDNLKDAGTLYGAIIYQKAPIVMRQLETIMGADAFRDGLREYLTRHRFGNASWPDLIAVLDARTAASDFARDEVQGVGREAGRPIVRTSSPSPATASHAGVHGRDPFPPRAHVDRGHAGDSRIRGRVQLVRAPGRSAHRRASARGMPAPLFVLPNGGVDRLRRIYLDAASLAWLSSTCRRSATR